MFVNGLVVQKYIDNSYKGIDGSGFSYNTAQNWFLNFEDDVPEPKFDCPDFKKVFLGYDYAYAAGDNYSAVYNEIPFVFYAISIKSIWALSNKRRN